MRAYRAALEWEERTQPGQRTTSTGTDAVCESAAAMPPERKTLPSNTGVIAEYAAACRSKRDITSDRFSSLFD